MKLSELQAIQNNIYIRDNIDEQHTQNFLYFLGSHTHLFQEFKNVLTNYEMDYIVQHFSDYDVEPRTFEQEFKRAMREAIPKYNILKKIELQDELFEIFDDKYTRTILSNRLTTLAENGTKQSGKDEVTQKVNKSANRDLSMASPGTSFDGIVDWRNGASGIAQTTDNSSNVVNATDITSLQNSGTDTGNTTETYKRERTPVETIDKIWNYIIKTKAIDYLIGEIATAFILVY